jgi:hypothetical protein
MRTPLYRTLLVAALAGPLVFLGCRTETEIEQEPDGGVEVERDTDVGVDEGEVDAALDSAGEAIEDAGEAVREGVEDAADAAEDAVDDDDPNDGQ